MEPPPPSGSPLPGVLPPLSGSGSPLQSPPLFRTRNLSASAPGAPAFPFLRPQCPLPSAWARVGGPSSPGEGTEQGQGVPGTGVPPPWQPRGSQEVFLLPILPECFLVFLPVFIPVPSPVVTGPLRFLVLPCEEEPWKQGLPWDGIWDEWGQQGQGTPGTEVLAAPGGPGSFPASHPP